MLLVRANEVVSTDALIDGLWGERPPASAAKSIQIYVSQLRKVIGNSALVTRPPGYALRLEHGELDLHRFEHLLDEGKDALAAGHAAEAETTLRDALSLWRGSPLADFAHEPFAQPEIARLEELRLSALEERIEADLALAHHADLIGELEALVAQHPLRERLRGQLMLALYRCGRQAEALELYQHTRRLLRDELGLEPNPTLQDLEQAILRQDPSLGAPPRGVLRTASNAARRRPRALIVAGAVLLAAAVAAGIIELTHGSGPGGIDHIAPNSVGAIDLKSNRIVAQVPVGTRPGPIVYGHGQLWVANLDNETVSRVDPNARAQTDVIALGAHPNALAVQRRGLWAATDRGVRAIDPAYDDVRTINVETSKPSTALFYSPPTAIAFTPDSAWVVIGSHITRANAKTGRRVDAIPVGNYPTALAGGAFDLWVTDNFDNAVYRIDNSGAITASTTVGRSPNSLAVGPRAVWVADADDDDVKRIDPNTATVLTTIPVGHHPSAIALSPGAVWVANQDDGTVSRIDERSNKVVKTIKVGGSPAGLAVAAGSLWVSVQASPLLGKAGGFARIDLDAPAIDPAEQDTFTLQAAAWEYATCAKLLNYLDKPAPAGSQLKPELARYDADGLAGRQDLHVQDPQRLPILASLEPTSHSRGDQAHDRAQPRPNTGVPWTLLRRGHRRRGGL